MTGNNRNFKLIMQKTRFTAILLFVSLALTGFAQAPKYSNEFLSIGVGARALGMSNAYITSVNDVTAGYWNPAGLMGIGSNMQVGLMHSEYFAGIAKYDYGAVATRIDSNSAIGFTLIRFGVDDIPNTTELIDAEGNIDYDKITSFSAADYGFLFSYARKLKIEGLNVGGNFKIIRRKVGDFAGAWGFGLDAGMQYQYKKWKFAAMGRDVTSTFNAWSFNLTDQMKEVFAVTGNEIPENSVEITLPKLLIGGARKFEMFKSKVSLITELDLDLTFDGKRNVLLRSNPVSIDPHWGFEVGYLDIVFVRGGIGNIQQSTDVIGRHITTWQPNIGVGLKLKSLSLDYALTDIGDRSVALYSNVFSLKLDINRKTK
jgi:hypothetical protein